MLKKILILLCVFWSGFNSLMSIVPEFFGARSLSLGYSSRSLIYDINAIFLNPSILANANRHLTGYQYQNSYMEYQNFAEKLVNLLNSDLKNFSEFNLEKKEQVVNQLKDLFQNKTGFYGFQEKIPGFTAGNYGFSISFVDAGIVKPMPNDILQKSTENITSQDIADLKTNFLGFRYKRFSLSYGINISSAIQFGVGFHYLNGKISDSKASLFDAIFSPQKDARDYLEDCWKDTQSSFSKFITDFSLGVKINPYITASLLIKNFNNPKITVPAGEITFKQRVITSVAFIPDPQLAIFIDMDMVKNDLLLTNMEMQPLSIGLEKGFYGNKFFLRGGLLTDLAGRNFLGKKANVMYGLGAGLSLGRVMVDFGLGLDHNGSINNLAISGFFVIK